MKTPTIYYNQGAKYYPKRKKAEEEETLVVCDCCYSEMEEGEGTTIYFDARILTEKSTVSSGLFK